MKNIDSIIDKWSILFDELSQFSFGDDDLDEELFKVAVKDAYYHFKNVVESQQEKTECMLTVKESQLLSFIYAYSMQNTVTSNLCEALQLIAGMLYDTVCFQDFFCYPVLSTELTRTYSNGEEESTDIEYNVDNGNLQDVIDILAD